MQLERNDEMRVAWEFVEHTNKSIFLTGKAGTGKTTFLKTITEKSLKRVVVVAPTGVAAINANGVTIHSFFQLPLSPFVPNARIRNRFDFNKEKRKIISTIDILVIDEISMVRSDLLDAIDSVLRRFRDHAKPFGGVQLLLIGDLGQLTPVITSEEERMLQPYYDTPYFFGSHALQLIDYVVIQLNRVYRQQDEQFLELLNHIRIGKPTAEDFAKLNARYQPDFKPQADRGYIRLTTHNNSANRYNESELGLLPSQPFFYQAEIEGTFPEYAYPTEQSMELKIGAQVMFIKNDPSADHLYYNGRIGRITHLSAKEVHVLCPGDNKAIIVQPQVWENSKYKLNEQTKEIETEVQGTFKQYPLRLAWAITIHKSQGLTFDHAIIDASHSFAPGQVYVALSRCRTLEGLVLASPLVTSSVINDQRVEAYLSQQQTVVQESIHRLPTLKEEYFRYLLLELFTFSEIVHGEEALGRVFIEYFHNSYAALTTLHKQVLFDVHFKLADIAEKWTVQIKGMSISQLRHPDFLDRIMRSSAYFEHALTDLFESLLMKSKGVSTQNKAAMKRLDTTFSDLQLTYLAHVGLLHRMAVEPFSVAGYLKAKQESLLDAMDAQNPSVHKRHDRKAKKPKPQKEPTQEITLRMYRQGLLPDAIAKERNLSPTTVYSHLGQAIAKGELLLSEFVPADKEQTIRTAIAKAGAVNSLSAIKLLCTSDITWNDLRLVLCSMKQPS